MTTTRRLMFLSLVFTLGCTDAADDTTRSQAVTQELVGEFCHALFSCACIDHTFPDESSCIATLEVSTHGLLDEGHEAGLTFDESCFREDFMSIDDQCRVTGVPTDVGESGVCRQCSTFHGSVPVGEACTQQGGFDDCEQGSFCNEGTCLDPCVIGALDEACSYRTQECEEGLICDPSADRCIKGPALGQPCHSGSLCAEGLRCNQDTDTCVALPGVGMPCPDLSCLDGVCLDGTCAPYGKAGAACYVRFDCEADLFCDVEPTSANGGTCREPRGGGEACELPEQCRSADCGPDGLCTAATPQACR